jgi:hypothetical protein
VSSQEREREREREREGDSETERETGDTGAWAVDASVDRRDSRDR